METYEPFYIDAEDDDDEDTDYSESEELENW